MVDSKKSSKKSGDNVFPRWLLFAIGGFVTLTYLEFNVLQIFRTQVNALELFYHLSGFLILLLPIPFIAFVMVPLIDKVNQIVNKRAIFIRISRNCVYAKRLDCYISHECSAEFSQQSEIVSDAENLAKAVSKCFRECTKDSKIALSPFVVFTATGQLSKVQRQAAEQAISEAGALCVKYMPECGSDSEALDFIRQHPYSSNFA